LSGEETRINQMVDDIISNAKTEANKFIDDAKKQTKEVLDKAEVVAIKEKQDLLEIQSKQINEWEKQQIASLNLQARRTVLQKKEEKIQEVYEQAKAELKKIPKKAAYDKVLEGLIIEAGSALGGGNLVIKARSEDKSKIKDLTALAKAITKACGNKCGLKLSKDTISALGGVVLVTEDGSITIDNTFDARLEQKLREIRTSVANKLFE
jgi:V/A-type H+-transporting ATPase subunit E